MFDETLIGRYIPEISGEQYWATGDSVGDILSTLSDLSGDIVTVDMVTWFQARRVYVSESVQYTITPM